jgi:hypothetical protein
MTFMKRLAALLSLFWAILGFGGAPAGAPFEQTFSVNVRDDEVAGCQDLEVRSDEDEIARDEEQFTIPVGSPVRLTPSQNGGVWIIGSTGGDVEVHACKIAAGSTGERAQQLLGQIRLQNQGGTISAEGAGARRYVYFIVRAPRGANVGAESSNGPITVRDAEGTFTLSAQNGPIGLGGVRGTIDARTQNGPISVKGSAGDFKLRAQNGPLTVKLDGVEWSGPGLVGETRNGPLSLTVPPGYRSGVLVEADGHSPIRCSGCSDAKKTWDDEGRKIEFGAEPYRIHLSTSNGPVSVVQR